MQIKTIPACITSIIAIFAGPAIARQPDTDTIIVQSSRLNQSMAALGSSVSIIKAADMERLGFGQALDALAQVSGVTVTQNGAFGGVASVRIRGAASGQTLVLIDGIPVNDPSAPAGGFNFAHLDTDMIHQIEVLKGPQSTLWGTDAIGGVVSIITKHPHRKETSRAFGEYGAFGTVRTGIAINKANSKRGILVSAVGTSSAGISKADKANDNTEKDAYDAITFAAKGNAEIGNRFTLTTNVLWTKSDTAFDSYAFGAQGNVADGDEHSTHESLSTNIALTGKAFESRLENTFLLGHTNAASDHFSTGVLNFSSQGERNLLRYQGRLRVLEKDTLVFGAEREETSSGDQHTHNTSFFALYEYNPVDIITFTSGVRVDDHTDFGRETTGRVAVALRPNDFFTLRTSAGQGFKAPTLFQRNYYCCGADAADPTLGAETAEGFDVSIDWHLSKMHTVLTYFKQNTDNQIDFSYASGRYENIAKVRTEGVEVSTRHQMTDWLGVTADYAYIIAKDTMHKRLPQIPMHSGDLALSITPEGPFSGTVLLRFNGTEKNLDGSTLNKWHRLDTNWRYKMNDRLEFYMHAENILNEEYQEILGYGTPRRSGHFGIKARF